MSEETTACVFGQCDTEVVIPFAHGGQTNTGPTTGLGIP